MRPLKIIISVASTLLAPSAIRLLRVGEVGRDGVLRGLGLPEISAEAGGMDGGVCGIGASFQPFFKIALGRDVWNMVDVAVAGLLLWTVWKEKSKTE